jgi:hypothetical protein
MTASCALLDEVEGVRLANHARKSSVDEVMIARGLRSESVDGITVIVAPSQLTVTRVHGYTSHPHVVAALDCERNRRCYG